jgi:hypothetical protein
MAGLDPAIHVSAAQDFEMDGARTRLSLPLKTFALEAGHDRWSA